MWVGIAVAGTVFGKLFNANPPVATGAVGGAMASGGFGLFSSSPTEKARSLAKDNALHS